MSNMAGGLVDGQFEVACEAFNADFASNGFSNAPQGLIKLFRRFEVRREESPDAARKRLYKRLWCLLWFGSKKTLGQGMPRGQPTYVYPPSLKRIIRSIIPGGLADYKDPTHNSVYCVTIEDLEKAKWPQ